MLYCLHINSWYVTYTMYVFFVCSWELTKCRIWLVSMPLPLTSFRYFTYNIYYIKYTHLLYLVLYIPLTNTDRIILTVLQHQSDIYYSELFLNNLRPSLSRLSHLQVTVTHLWFLSIPPFLPLPLCYLLEKEVHIMFNNTLQHFIY